VSSICGGSRFTGLEDGQGFMKKFQNLISIMDFIETFFHCFKRTLPRFLQKLSFDKKLAKKPKSSVFETISGFCSFLLVELISNFQIFKIHWIFSLYLF
jgi:hypothetical protein